MDRLQRYHIDIDEWLGDDGDSCLFADVNPGDAGEWCKSEDVAALEAENAALREALHPLVRWYQAERVRAAATTSSFPDPLFDGMVPTDAEWRAAITALGEGDGDGD